MRETAGAASASSTTMSTLSQTRARPHIPTSRPCAGTTIKPRPNETAKPGCCPIRHTRPTRHERQRPQARH